jgi:hypothetical protein
MLMFPIIQIANNQATNIDIGSQYPCDERRDKREHGTKRVNGCFPRIYRRILSTTVAILPV